MPDLFKPATNNQAALPIPAMTMAEMEELYRTLDKEHTLSAVQRAEVSGLRIAELARMILTDDDNDCGVDSDDDSNDSVLDDRPIAVLAGLDDVGAAGLFAARYLESWGGWVQVITTHPAEQYQDAARFHVDSGAALSHAMAALQEEGIATAWAEDGWELPPADLLIDALPLVNASEGNGETDRDWDHPTKTLIQLANSHQAPILSVGLPAGLDAETGQAARHHLSAQATIWLGLPPSVAALAHASRHLGDCYLADIALPADLYHQRGVDNGLLFAESTIVQIDHK